MEPSPSPRTLSPTREAAAPSPAARRPPRRPGARILALLALGAGLILLAAAGFAAWPRQIAQERTQRSVIPQAVNFPLPEGLALTTLAGEPASLESLRGNVVLLNNWATWCPPCREEMPALEAYHWQHRSQGFTVLAVNAEEDAATVQAFLRQTGLQLPVWLDPQGSMFRAFGYNSLPTSFVVDRTGVVRLAWAGPISRSTLELYVTPLLGR